MTNRLTAFIFCPMAPRLVSAFLFGGWLYAIASAGPPVARFQSVLGDFDVLLDSVAAPISVANFTAYANRGAYDGTFLHRSTTYDPADIQIVQGGGFELVGNSIDQIPTDPPIPLEAGLPNSRGTIAMARATDPNSATSQWFFNVTDNPLLGLDYAVFGRVLGGGLSVVDAMASLKVYDASNQLGGAFSELPLRAPALSASNLVLFPSVRTETFAITNLTRSGNTAEIHWTPLSTNTPVRVERSTDLAGPWDTVSSNNTTGVYTDNNAPAGRAFYRVVTE